MTEQSITEQTQQVIPTATVLAAWADVQSGKISREKFFQEATHVLHLARVVIAHMVEAFLARQQPHMPIVGRGAGDYSDRDKASLETITEDVDTAQERIERFVHSTLEQYSRDELIDISADYGATGWRWVAHPTACDYCKGRDGKEYGLDVAFRDHPNCLCRPEPIWSAGFNSRAEEEVMADA